MQDMDTFNYLVSQLRSDNIKRQGLDYYVASWLHMDRGEYRAALRPYVARHAADILESRDHEPTATLWEKLCGDAGQQITIAAGGDTLRPKTWNDVRKACAGMRDIYVTLEIVHAMPSTFHVTASGVTHTARNWTYTPRWSYDQAVEVGEDIVADMTRDLEGDEPATAWGWFRALVRTLATSYIDWEEGYLHETYEQASYYSAVSSAEHSLVCEVAAALHPDIPYTTFFSCAVDSPESTMINSLVGILGEFVQTEESNGDIYASISLGPWNAQDVLNQLTELALAWGNDPEDAPGIARRTLCEWSDAGRYL